MKGVLVLIAVNSWYTPSVRHLEHAENALRWNSEAARVLVANRNNFVMVVVLNPKVSEIQGLDDAGWMPSNLAVQLKSR